ncbi:hypothetical protein ACP4OV_006891 [Aristida adscensionis]
MPRYDDNRYDCYDRYDDDHRDRYDRYDDGRYDRSGHYARHGTKLYVGSISPHTQIHELRELFSRYGSCLMAYGLLPFLGVHGGSVPLVELVAVPPIFKADFGDSFEKKCSICSINNTYGDLGVYFLLLAMIHLHYLSLDGVTVYVHHFPRVQHVYLKEGFGFVEFADPRAADDAIHDLDGREFNGSRIIVDFARGYYPGPRARGPPRNARCYNCGIEGHWAQNCQAGDWKNRCYKCGEEGHVERNCQNSRKDLKYAGEKLLEVPISPSWKGQKPEL